MFFDFFGYIHKMMNRDKKKMKRNLQTVPGTSR